MMRVSNMTACFSLSRRINLHRLVKECLFASWTRGRFLNQRSFNSVKLQVYTKERRVIALMYTSGRVVLIGGQSQAQLQEAVLQIRLLTGCGLRDPLVVSNYVFATFFQPDVPLESLCEMIEGMRLKSLTADLNPELFPAVIIKILDEASNKSVKVTLFHTGKANITGCRELSQGLEARAKIEQLLILLTEK